MNYLGIIITSANTFKVNLQQVRHKFFRAVNAIFGRVGLNTSPVTLCSLIDHCCLPILLYASESIPWNKSLMQSIENAYSQAFFKIFHASDTHTLKCCQFYMGCLPIELRIMQKKLKFLSAIKDSKSLDLWNLPFVTKNDELESIFETYNIPRNFTGNARQYFWKYFEDKLTSINP